MSARTALEIIDPGLQTTVQAWPGRQGLTSLGYFPAGPMDHLSLRAANVLVGNPAGAPALEVPKIGISVAFLIDTQIAVAAPDGAAVLLNDVPAAAWETVDVRAGDVLRTIGAGGPGFRLYLAVRGGIAVPEVYGSAATSLVAGIGGVEGRALVRSDLLAINGAAPIPRRRLPEAMRPRFGTEWEIEIIQGPHACPDYLTPDDWAELLGRQWRVDLNSDRIATRLNPYRFTWARPDGGSAGGHPSNVLDDAYPVGGVLANGDVLTILGMDGNTSGGFAVVATVPHCALWKVGQMRPGRDTIRFREVDYEEALALNQRVDFTVDPRRTVRVQ
ncbi:urea carboxylase [Nocardia farcinica]|uniref:Allophanate hydrolase subunit 2 n=1 Tax=Nocardia farcinica TaxID=37329 RepID=A0A0H5ND56_NOCFR|nr:biotin-dependent carboxyltransferase family protein [Nocardia farcinica]AXK88918.1 urea amidolyase [Nocardia farcinica]PFX03945.1 KipI antagonist [Nocardia farcinica]PFX10103.1 KipI antagonist [Nocardia farcinica]CRY73810.1 Allophanate hydrolase subunit 2 [Nocardia farcinica]SIT24466.1 urea carboxylase [Nocardia farcinica]